MTHKVRIKAANAPRSKPSSGALIERLVRIAPGVSRPELAAALGLSHTTVNMLVADAIDAGMFAEQPIARREGISGRPRRGLTFAGPPLSFALVTWTHGVLSSALVGFDGIVQRIHEEIIDRADFTPSAEQVTGALDAVLARAAGTGERPSVAVLSLPAPYEHGTDSDLLFRTRFAPEAFGRWFAQPPAQALQEQFGVPVIVHNDSNLSALGESRAGAGRRGGVMIYARLSDRGVGSSLVIDGEPFRGAAGFAGEISHAQVSASSTTICPCGSRGCLRTLLGPALLAPLHAYYGEGITYKDLLRLADANEPGAIRVLEDAGRAIAVPLAQIVTFVTPDVLVLEAGNRAASAAVLGGLEDQFRRSTAPFLRDHLDLTVGSLGDRAMHVGALAYARDRAIGVSAVARRFRRLASDRMHAGEPASGDL